MKQNLVFLVILILFSSIFAALADEPAWPSTPRLRVNGAGELVDDAHPLPVKATGTTAVNQPPVTTGTSSALLLTSTPQYISPLAGQRFIVGFATGTWAYGIGNFVASISNRPEVYSATIVGSYGISVWTTATPTYLGIDKIGD